MRGLEAVAPMPGETPVQATVRKMSSDDADLFATRIVVLFGEVARAGAARAQETEAAATRAERFDEARSERYADDGANVIPLLYAAEA